MHKSKMVAQTIWGNACPRWPTALCRALHSAGISHLASSHWWNAMCCRGRTLCKVLSLGWVGVWNWIDVGLGAFVDVKLEGLMVEKGRERVPFIYSTRQPCRAEAILDLCSDFRESRNVHDSYVHHMLHTFDITCSTMYHIGQAWPMSQTSIACFTLPSAF